VFAQHKIDALIFPTTPMAAQTLDKSAELTIGDKKVPTFFYFISNTDPGSNAGIPGLSLPMGLTREGVPAGLELDGPVGSDRRLLGIGLALEKVLKPLPPPRF
jgi:mandelamide amidase